jgi:RNA polymerase sigma-70 factor, ECF subfamily
MVIAASIDAAPPLENVSAMTQNARSDVPCSADEQNIAWMQRVKAGDMEAFEALVEAHQNHIIGTVAKMLGDSVDAEDIAQQVFIRVWKSAARYEPRAKFTTWLFTITRNLVFNELSRRKRRPQSTPASQDQHESGTHDMHAPDDAILEEELQAAIQAAIDALPETQRMAIILRRYEDLSYEEIGEILGLTVPAVKSVLFRARTELKARLQKYLTS